MGESFSAIRSAVVQCFSGNSIMSIVCCRTLCPYSFIYFIQLFFLERGKELSNQRIKTLNDAQRNYRRKQTSRM